MEAYHSIVTQVSAGADHTVAITAAGEVYSWGGIVEHVTHASIGGSGGSSGATLKSNRGKEERKQMEKRMKKEQEEDERLFASQMLSRISKLEKAKQRNEKYMHYLLQEESEDTPCLMGRALGVLGDGSVKSFANSPR